MARRDVDAADQAIRLRILVFAACGGIIGGWAGVYVAETRGWSGPTALATVLAGLLFAGAAVYVVATQIVRKSGELVEHLYNPSGCSTPSRPEYSYVRSLVARGRFEEALAELRRACAESPTDPEPRLRLARLLRDELGRHEGAIAAFRKVRESTTDADVAMMATREIVETCATKLDAPRRAMPDLARLAHDHAGTPAAEWARERLAVLKRELRQSTDW